MEANEDRKLKLSWDGQNLYVEYSLGHGSGWITFDSLENLSNTFDPKEDFDALVNTINYYINLVYHGYEE